MADVGVWSIDGDAPRRVSRAGVGLADSARGTYGTADWDMPFGDSRQLIVTGLLEWVLRETTAYESPTSCFALHCSAQAAGASQPRLLCGRVVLYSIRQSQISTCSSSRLSNCSTARNSSRNRPLTTPRTGSPTAHRARCSCCPCRRTGTSRGGRWQ